MAVVGWFEGPLPMRGDPRISVAIFGMNVGYPRTESAASPLLYVTGGDYKHPLLVRVPRHDIPVVPSTNTYAVEIYALSSYIEPVLLSTEGVPIAIEAFETAEDVLDAMANALEQIHKFSPPSERGTVEMADMGTVEMADAPLVDLESYFYLKLHIWAKMPSFKPRDEKLTGYLPSSPQERGYTFIFSGSAADGSVTFTTMPSVFITPRTRPSTSANASGNSALLHLVEPLLPDVYMDASADADADAVEEEPSADPDAVEEESGAARLSPVAFPFNGAGKSRSTSQESVDNAKDDSSRTAAWPFYGMPTSTYTNAGSPSAAVAYWSNTPEPAAPYFAVCGHVPPVSDDAEPPSAVESTRRF